MVEILLRSITYLAPTLKARVFGSSKPLTVIIENWHITAVFLCMFASTFMAIHYAKAAATIELDYLMKIEALVNARTYDCPCDNSPYSTAEPKPPDKPKSGTIDAEKLNSLLGED